MRKIEFLGSWPKAIVHLDGDAFFASCEQAVHPEYRGKPVVTGKERGIVAAASYEAKRLGISRGVSLWDVKRICPDAIIVPSDYETYSLFSKRMFAIMRRFSPVVEEYSIDEGFVDLTGLQRPFHASYEGIARQMKQTVEKELGITVSVGLSVSKVLAKIGSKWKKPSGFVSLPTTAIFDYLAKTPVEKIWGIGEKTAAYCEKLGIQTALQFAEKNEDYIKKHFIKPQYEIWQELNGYSVYSVTAEEKTDYASISKTKTFTPPSKEKAFVYAQLIKNLENACIKARRHHLVAGKVVAFLKTQEYSYSGLEATLNRLSSFPMDIAPLAKEMFEKIFEENVPYRATGIVLVDLQPEGNVQMSLFESPLRVSRLQRLYQAIDTLAQKMGKHTVFLGATAHAHKIPQHILERGDVPVRKLNRLDGETIRKHLSIPMLMNKGTQR